MNEIFERINQLSKERNAIIIAHNYQRGDVQDIADFVGDSLELSQKASKIDADVIVFCGVHFMAETASILSPDKTVILPDADAGCPMADMIDVDGLLKLKSEYPKAKVVCYVNSSAEVKAESDICCTSANATRIVASFPADQEIIFIPDQYLGHYAASQSEREVIPWHGYCPTHAKIISPDIEQMRKEHPNAKVVVHPECRPDVIDLADAVASTSGILKFCRQDNVQEVIVGTEMGIIHRLQKENPGKKFFPISEKAVCPNMKRITPEKVLQSLEEMKPEVKVPEQIRLRAKTAVDRMLEI